ncbi:MAG: nickel pincer cofactor biosynthesis protein LarB [Geobacter sp.]|nr:nickel pincer cofactor biosynthesis protein LarB [Geobacter sp.]
MQEDQLRELLRQVAQGELTPHQGVERLRHLPFEDLGFAQVDHHRGLRQGQPEVIFGQGKTVEQIRTIVENLHERGSNVLVTRLDQDRARELQALLPATVYHDAARCLTLESNPPSEQGRGTILIVAAGTSDLPVASEALVTSRFLGNKTELLCDVGVAGIHRLLSRMELLRSATVLIVVAGMEGALPSVVGGLVDKPVIAVPTSVGYGASFGGIAALLGMLNSCASGVTVVNIDNGFGAACAASLINRNCHDLSLS